jgi:anaerobic magnesium-protoporphyrin IX monomethyl ester cyclase
MARVLLINPPLIDKRGRYIDGYQGARPKLPALGIAYLASVLIQAGHQVKIIEGMAEYLPLDKIASLASSFDIVGITSNTFHAFLSHRVARAIKEQNRNIPVVMGGPHASVVPEEVLADKNIDFVVIGEGEYTLLELVETLISKGNFEAVKGIAFRKDSKIIFSGERACKEDLDEIPLPARELLPMHLYSSSAVRSHRNPALHMVSSRGCFHNCSFCCNKSIYRCRLRMHSSVRVVEEMKVLVKDFGAKEIHFWDDCFVYNEERVYRICQMLRQEGLNIPWDCEATIDRVNPALLKEMHSSGCFGVSYGIETGNDERFKKLNKGWMSKDKIRKAVAWTRQAKLRVRGYFMLGFIGEDLQEMERTIQFSKELDLDYATFSSLVPLPGTDDYEKAKEEGNFDAYYWRSKILSEISFPLDVVYTPKGVSKEQLLMMHRKACRDFYLRPKIIFRHIMGLWTIDGFLYSLKTAYNIIKSRRIRNYDN